MPQLGRLDVMFSKGLLEGVSITTFWDCKVDLIIQTGKSAFKGFDEKLADVFGVPTEGPAPPGADDERVDSRFLKKRCNNDGSHGVVHEVKVVNFLFKADVGGRSGNYRDQYLLFFVKYCVPIFF